MVPRFLMVPRKFAEVVLWTRFALFSIALSVEAVPVRLVVPSPRKSVLLSVVPVTWTIPVWLVWMMGPLLVVELLMCSVLPLSMVTAPPVWWLRTMAFMRSVPFCAWMLPALLSVSDWMVPLPAKVWFALLLTNEKVCPEPRRRWLFCRN